MNVGELISDAYQTSQILRQGGTPSGDQNQYALRWVNMTLDQWRSEYIEHGLSDVTETTALYDGALISALRKALAVHLREHLGLPPMLLLVNEAASEKSRLLPFTGKLEIDRGLLF